MSQSNVDWGGRHEEYKEGTNKLAGWLLHTANDCTDIRGLVHAVGRTHAKKHNHKAAPREVALSTKEFTALAKAILQAVEDGVHDVKIPGHVFRRIKRVINLRLESHDKYATKSMTEQNQLNESDRRHLYFIKVLQEVETILEDAYNKIIARRDSTEAAMSMPDCSREVDLLTAKMRDLPLEVEDAEHVPAAHHISRAPASKKTPKPTNLVNLSGTKVMAGKEADDLTFEVWCHLMDMHDITASIQYTWQQLREEKISFLHASNATDVAFKLLRCQDDMFSGLHPELDDYDTIVRFLGFEVIVFDGEPMVYIANRGDSTPHARGSQAPANVLELLCPFGANINEAFQQSLARHTRSMQYYQRTKKAVVREKPSSREEEWRHHHEFARVLLDNVGAIYHYGKHNNTERTDDFVEGLISHGNRTWVNVCCQIYADVFEQIGPHRGLGCAALHSCLLQHLNANRILTQIQGDSKSGMTVAESMELETKNTRKAIKTLQMSSPGFNRGDFACPEYGEYRKQIQEQENSAVSGLEHFLPIHAGVTAYKLYEDMTVMSCKVANSTGIFHAAYCVYQAQRQIGALHHDWPDLEALSPSYSSGGPWMKDLKGGNSLAELRSAYITAAGFNLSDFTSASVRSTARSYSKAQIYRKGKPFQGSMIPRLFSEVEAKSNSEAVKTSAAKRVQIALHDRASRRHMAESSTTDRRFCISPLLALKEFNTLFAEGEVLLTMDLSSFQSTLAEVFSKAHRKFDFFGELHGVEDVPSELKPSECALLLLSNLVNHDKQGRDVSNSVLFKAASIFSEHIGEQGSTFTDAALEKKAKDRPRGPKLYQFDEAAQAKRTEFIQSFKRAGTSVYCNGTMMVLYHPALRRVDLDISNARPKTPGKIELPSFLRRSGSELVEPEYQDVKGKNTVEADNDIEAHDGGVGTESDGESLSDTDSNDESEREDGTQKKKNKKTSRKSRKNRGKKKRGKKH